MYSSIFLIILFLSFNSHPIFSPESQAICDSINNKNITSDLGNKIEFQVISSNEYVLKLSNRYGTFIIDTFYCTTRTFGIIDENENFIVLRNGCGTACWNGLFINLKNGEYKIVNNYLDYNLEYGTIVSATTKSIIIENLYTKKTTEHQLEKECKSAVPSDCISNLKINENSIVFEWNPEALPTPSNKNKEYIPLRGE